MQNTGQVISRLEVQMGQLAYSLSERPKRTLTSQPVANPMNSSQAHLAQEDHTNQCNLIHTLRSGKRVDNQVSTPSSSTQASTSSSPTPLHLTPTTLKKTTQLKMCTSL